MNLTVSVIIPVFNGENFISRAIDSVLHQSVPVFEIIVVNDGSTDGTAAQLLRYQDKVKILTIANGGVSNARNTGIEASCGDYIAFLDADDVWDKDKIKLQLEVFAQYADVGFCCSNFMNFNSYLGKEVEHFSILENDADFVLDQPLVVSAFQNLIKINFVGTCSNVMINKAVLKQTGLFNVNYKQAEDYDLWLRCALVTQFVLQSRPLVVKKTHDTNLTNNFLETLLCHEQVLINLRNNPVAQSNINQINAHFLHALAAVRYEIGNHFYERNLKLDAFQYYLRGWLTIFSYKNSQLFLYYAGRKLLRTISFGFIRNHSK